MIVRTLLAIAAISCCSASLLGEDQVNLASNGGFEQEGAGWAFRVETGDSAQARWEIVPAETGKELRITNTDEQDGVRAIVWQTLGKLEPGLYQISARVRAKIVGKGVARAGLCFNHQWGYSVSSVGFGDRQEATRVTLPFWYQKRYKGHNVKMMLTLTGAGSVWFDDVELVRLTEHEQIKVNDKLTRLVYAPGAELLKFNSRDKPMWPEKAHEDLSFKRPRLADPDVKRGFVTFARPDRDGILPEYTPLTSELTDKVSIFASPGEFEPATFALHPLDDLGEVTFTVNDFVAKGGQTISADRVDAYIGLKTCEQADLLTHAKQAYNWRTKWLRPGSRAQATKQRNVQLYLDVHVPEDAAAGDYEAEIDIATAKGKRGTFTVALEVLPINLGRSIPWGLYMYDWGPADGSDDDWLREKLRELRRSGITHATISPSAVQHKPGFNRDGVPDYSYYNRAMDLYEEAGFPEPAVVAMENFFYGLVSELGRNDELKFHKDGGNFVPGVKADEVPEDIKELLRRALRRLYDNSLAQKWPPFYFYPADEPGPGTDRMTGAVVVASLAREAAPEMRIAISIYRSLNPPLDELVSLHIYHMVHPAWTEEGARSFMRDTHRQNRKLHGISWLAATRDCMLDGRGPTMVLERAGMDGMTDWVQWPGWKGKKADLTDPYFFLYGTWKGGPFFVVDEDGNYWRSLPWIGVREGIDDSRYLRTAKTMARRASTSTDPLIRAHGHKAKLRIDAIMQGVAFWSNRGAKNYSGEAFDKIRRRLAQVALDLQIVLSKE